MHPSGYCVWFNDKSVGNLITGEVCPHCKRTAGHKYTCQNFTESETPGASSRPKVYNAVAILYHRSTNLNFITFTLPSKPGRQTYQVSPYCEDTGDLAVTKIFSKMMEAIAVKVKRSARPNQVSKFSYVWCSEAQMERQAKFGGVGDLHFHLVTNQYIDIQWLQATWSAYFPDCQDHRNSVHLEPIPPGINSVPAYMAKYMGKGSCRRIYSRRYGCSRDLSALVPIRLNHLPDSLQAITQKIYTQANGYESVCYYFNTAEILARYGRFMSDEKDFNVTRGGRNFTPGAIASRKFVREIKENQRRHAAEVGLIDF